MECSVENAKAFLKGEPDHVVKLTAAHWQYLYEEKGIRKRTSGLLFPIYNGLRFQKK